MTTDACATCGHGQHVHVGYVGGCGLCGTCTGYRAYIPSRPVPEEVCVCGHRKDEHGGGRCHHLNYRSGCEVHACSSCNGFTPATVPAPHAEAEARYMDAVDIAWQGWKEQNPGKANHVTRRTLFADGFIAGYLRGRGDRGN